MRPDEDLACREFVEFVTGCLEGALALDVRERFEARLRVCDGCELHLGQMRPTVRTAAHRRREKLPAPTRRTVLRALHSGGGRSRV